MADYLDEMNRECDRCGKLRECSYCYDPFISEIYPEDPQELAWWCEQCYQDRKDDI